ncbi:MAG: hypothetical protein DMG32_02560 [Acidobacteria bacterium]|nr:MAG: hypothetical protein DMG32_02560 [Acidobacteriota bacterium]
MITEIGAESANDTDRNFYYIHENAAEFGLSARVKDKLRINADFMAGYTDNSFTRISPRQLQSYRVHATYEPKPWANVSAAVDIQQNRDNVYAVNHTEHGRTYSLTASPRSDFTVDFGYSYMCCAQRPIPRSWPSRVSWVHVRRWRIPHSRNRALFVLTCLGRFTARP